MMTQTGDALVEDYLGRLHAASWPLAPDRRAELVDGIREHIAEARAAGASSEADVRAVLSRLGDPEEIAQSAAREGGAAIPPYPVVVQKPSLVHETWTVCLLAFGSFAVPVVGWIAGAVLLLAGKRWRWWEKALGLLVFPGGPIGALLLLSFGTQSGGLRTCTVTGSTQTCTGETHSYAAFRGVTVFAVVLLAPLIVDFYLFRVARRRAEAELPALLPA